MQFELLSLNKSFKTRVYIKVTITKANESYFKIYESLCHWRRPLLGNS